MTRFAGFVLGFAAALILAASPHADAQSQKPIYSARVAISAITDLALDASSTNTGWIDTKGNSTVTLYFDVETDANDSVTAINATCETSEDGGKSGGTAVGSGFHYCGRASSGATTTMTCPHTFTFDPSGSSTNKTGFFYLEDLDDQYVNCAITDTGGAAADILDGWYKLGSP